MSRGGLIPRKKVLKDRTRICPMHPARYGKNYGLCNQCFTEQKLRFMDQQNYLCACGAPLTRSIAHQIGFRTCVENDWAYMAKQLWSVKLKDGMFSGLSCLKCSPPESKRV